MVPSRLSLLIPLLLILAACGSEVALPPPYGEAYAGPAILPLRQDISLRSPVVINVKHGDKLGIVEAKRRFVRVRTAKGAEGWVDAHLLMSTSQMKELAELTARAVAAPSEGTAVILETLNMHTEPNRLSPSFRQLTEKTEVQIIDRKVTLRTQPGPPGLVLSRPAPARKSTKKKLPLLEIAPPRPPKPPANWMELSKDPVFPQPVQDEDPAAAKRKARQRAKEAPPVDDWSLVRTKEGKAGWVLSRMINVSIPDEVAQYAEGKRITSYFSLGEVHDEENGLKHDWLWTTMNGIRTDCDFDAFRVFIWNRRRHRYETAYHQGKLLGRYPVEANLDGRKGSFELILSDDGGPWVRRRYILEGAQVHRLSEEAYVPGQPRSAPQNATGQTPQAASAGWFSTLKQKVRKLFGR
jgi:hypothetical protein